MKTLNGRCWLIVLAFASVMVSGNFYFPPISPNNEWWSNTIIYQVYPRSFKDSNNDGIGDLRGIMQKIDHFADIGVETLWIGPIFKSPMEDMGYDVENYTAIDPMFGTMEDFEELVLEMKKRNLKLITDLVPNHSSSECEWFKKSVAGEGKYKDYYVWRDASNQIEVLANSSVKPVAPNNWLSIFGYSGWTWNEDRKQFFFHQFNPRQPDFNFRNPDVRKEFKDILEFWMNKGIVGFRFDALRHLFEHASFLDEPYIKGKEGSLEYGDTKHIYILDQPEVIDAIIEWREHLENYTKNKNLSMSMLMTTESYSPREVLNQYYGNATHPGAQIPFNFGFVEGVKKYNYTGSIDIIIRDFLENIPKDTVPNWAMENHDNIRMATSYGPESVPLFTALKLALPGVDVTYYGSEIGMSNMYVRPDQRQDPNNAGASMSAESRDGERCPMQWDDSLNAGFTGAKKPWLPVNENYYKVNVETQKKNPQSNYNFYKKMVQLRKTDTLKYGDLQTYNTSELYIMKRSLAAHESYIVVANFGTETETVFISSIVNKLKEKLYVYLGSENSAYNGGNIIITNSNSPLILRPKSVVVLTDKEIETEPQTKAGSGSNTKNGSKLISLFCAFLLTRFTFF